MNEQELDAALSALAAERVVVPDLSAPVRREIRRRGAGASRGGHSALPFPALLMPASLLAAVAIGVAVRFTFPIAPQVDPQIEATNALHLNIFTSAPVRIAFARLPQTER